MSGGVTIIKIVVGVYSLLMLGVYIAYGSILIRAGKKFNPDWLVSSSALNEVADNWKVLPFVDAVVVPRQKVFALDLDK